MTETQVKYQTLMENRRHNLEMEELGAQEQETKRRDSGTRAREASVKERQVQIAEDMKMYDEFAQMAKGAADTARFMGMAISAGAGSK